jgi:hypothetical protein
MIFKSFDQFITESTSANLVPINESRFGGKFKVTVNTPQPGETYNLSFSAVINPGKSPNYQDTEDQIIDMAKGYAEESLSVSTDFKAAAEARDSNGKDPAAVIFIRVKTLRQRTVLNKNILFDADLVFKYSSNFKSPTEIQTMIVDGDIKPYMVVNPTNGALADVYIWDISQMAALIRNN